MSSRRVTALTKEGVKNLHDGHIINAVLSLRHAAECLKSCHQVLLPRSEEHEMMVEDTNASALLHVPLSLNATCVTHSSPHNAFDIYASAFLHPFVKDVTAYHHEVSIVLFYNLGLAHHLAATHGAPDSDKHLQRALRCYKIALTVFQQRGRLHFDDWYSLLLGLLNNMGHIYCHSFQMDEVKTCSKHIDALLSSPDAEHLSEEDGAFFFGAVLQTRSFDGINAPAA